MITQIILKQFFNARDVRAIGKLIPRQFTCVTARSQKVPYEGAELHRKILSESPV